MMEWKTSGEFGAAGGLLASILISEGRQWLQTREMGCIYFDGSIMVAVGAEEGAGGRQTSELCFGHFFP